jgi:glycerate kinase
MKILVAVDSFKGSLTSLEAGEAVRRGALRALPNQTEVIVRPLADGGEGTVDALTRGLGGRTETLPVTGPLGTPVEASYGILPDGTAVIEMAAAAGLPLVPEAQRDPLRTTTRGVGELIADALAKGCRRFVLGIGGSATNDGGAGMLQALGFELLDAAGQHIAPGAQGLADLAAIRTERALPLRPEFAGCSFRVACDVTNPLCGPQGCSAVYGPQKGATPESIAAMDGWLAAYATLAATVCPGADIDLLRDRPGAGAAGGLGFALCTFLGASLESGVGLILEATGFEALAAQADLVVTGEGRLDAQSVQGKAPIGVARLAKRHGKPVIAFCGCTTADARVCNAAGIDAYFPILRAVQPLEQAMQPQTAAQNLEATAEQVFRLLRIAQAARL